MVVIEIKQSTKCFEPSSLYLTFNYNPDIIHIIKMKPERYWLPEQKVWEVPLKYLDVLKEDLKNFGVTVLGETKVIESKVEQKLVEIPKDYKFKTTPYNHQYEGIKYGLNNDAFFLNDEQGVGKTMQVINIACIRKQLYNYKHCLIVCGINGLKWNWQKEIAEHSNEQGYILGTVIKYPYTDKEYEVIGSVEDRIKDLETIKHIYIHPEHKINLYDPFPYFLITNIETLRNDKVIQLLKEMCANKIINMVAIDEIHKCKSPTSIQGKNILKVHADSMVAMTGTPLMNTPLDLYVPLKWLGKETHSFYAFKNHYCVMGGYGGYEIVGYKNLEQLRALYEECSLRRLKKDVLDLPEKIYQTEYVEMSPKQSKIYKEVKMEIRENIDMIKSSPNPLAEMIRLRQATGYTGILSSTIKESAKFDRLEELLEDINENGDKAIIFSNWVSITSPLFDRLKKYNPAIITGETKDRVAEQDKFMNDDTCKVIIGTIGAMGTGLTLTAANTVIFLDEPWNRANKEQAEDRAHRIGTKNNVNIITFICKDTIDEKIHELLLRKGALADMLVDGIVTPENREKLVDFLLS